jgi:putative hydrolase of the HAD superfamily
MTFDLIAFDADDTLWKNEEHYTQGREMYRQLLAKYGVDEPSDERLDEIEISNLKYFGYGVTSFVISMIETAIELTDYRLSNQDIQKLLSMAKDMITVEVVLHKGAEETLHQLSASYPLLLVTKGDLVHQGSKIERSGLKEYFHEVEIVSDKTPQTYTTILSKFEVSPNRFLMIGNSLRSDVLPVIELGGWAIHIPNALTWSHETKDIPSTLNDKYFVVEDLSQVPDFIQRLSDSQDTNNPVTHQNKWENE